MCSVTACLLHAVHCYMEHHRIYIATLKLFCVLTSVQLLMNIFCIYEFVAFMNLLYADETSGYVLNLIFATHMDPKDIF